MNTKKMFPKYDVDDNTYYDPAFWKYGTFKDEAQYYPLIGELVSVFNALEDSLSDELIKYIENEKMPNAAYLIIVKLSFSTKWQLWTEILLNYINEDLDDLTSEDKLKLNQHESKITNFRDTFERFGKIRNDLVHGTWGFMNEKGLIKTRTKTNKKKQIVHEHIEIKKEDFELLILEIQKFDIAFSEYNTEIHKELD